MMSNAKDRELSMIVWVVIAGFLLWLAAMGLSVESCIQERDEMDRPAAPAHARALWRSR